MRHSTNRQDVAQKFVHLSIHLTVDLEMLGRPYFQSSHHIIKLTQQLFTVKIVQPTNPQFRVTYNAKIIIRKF
jgi:hypothetical protein